MQQPTDVNEKLRELLRQRGPDLSMEEDLALAVMNLVSFEEHAFFTAAKTGKQRYLALLEEARTLRAALMARMLDRTEGETWCMAKHLLAATMRLIEVGTKLQRSGQTALAETTFRQAYTLFGKFWEIRLGQQKGDPGAARGTTESSKERGTIPWTADQILEQLVDCCSEQPPTINTQPSTKKGKESSP